MCIYNHTLFACGASHRKLEQRCPAEHCHPHIRWTYYSADNCAECGNLPQEADGPVFGAETVLPSVLAAGNACRSSGYLQMERHPDNSEVPALPVRSEDPSDFGDDEASSSGGDDGGDADADDEWAGRSQEELLDVELDDADRTLLADIDRSSSRGASSPERIEKKRNKTVTFAAASPRAAPMTESPEGAHETSADFIARASRLEEGMMAQYTLESDGSDDMTSF